MFEQIAAELAASGVALRARWIDIEDEADLVDDLDIETFPTVVVYDARQLHFAGPLTPQPETLRRLLASLVDSAGTAAGANPAFEALVQRLR